MNAKNLSIFSKDYPKHKTLQKTAFPKEEQYPFWILRLLALRKGIDYLTYYDNGLFCGISYTSCTEHMLYVLYLAVNEEIRSKGYGSKILDYLKEITGNRKIALNIEPPDKDAANYDQRIRRMEFYRRNEFSDTGYRLVDVTGTYMVLSNSDKFDAAEYKKAISRIGMSLYRPKIIKKGAVYGREETDTAF